MTSPACSLRRTAEQVREDDAMDFANAVVDAARVWQTAVIVRLHPDGATEIERHYGTPFELVHVAPLSIVGVYTSAADPRDVRDDLLAMPRRGWEDAP